MNRKNQVTLHPDFIKTLFAYKNNVSSIFNDILGLYEISHFAISYIDSQNEMLTFSSTPSLEFNLFSSNLWLFDNTYQDYWFTLCSVSPWQALYKPECYDQLFYLKQLKHDYPIGVSMAAKTSDSYTIFSLASHAEDSQTQEYFANHYADFYKIGEYCSQALMPLLAIARDSE